MLTVIANPPSEYFSNIDYRTSAQNIIPTVTNLWTVLSYWIDKTNKYIYILSPRTASTWFTIRRYDYNAWIIWSGVDITLSGFWTFTSQPIFHIFQGSHSWDFYLYCESAWWSASFAALTIYPITFSWTTATRWTANTLPVVASYTLRNLYAKWAVLYAFYALTGSPFTANVTRKFSGSWTTLTWNALLTSVWAFTWTWEMFAWQWRFPAWSSNTKLYLYHSSGWGAVFDTWTEAWSLETRITGDQIICDVSWITIVPNFVILADWTSIVWPSMPAVSSPVGSIWDMNNWIALNIVSSWSYYFSGWFVWAARILRRVFWTLQNDNCFVFYSTDNWTTWKTLPYLTTLISDFYNLNYRWDIICIPFYTTTTKVMTVEVA